MRPISRELYNRIIKEVSQINLIKLTPEFTDKFKDVGEESLRAILFQEYQEKMKREFHIHHTPEQMDTYYERYLENVHNKMPQGFLTQIAKDADLSPSLMAKIIVEQYYKRNAETPLSQNKLTKVLRYTNLIECPILSHEVNMCHLFDPHYGPWMDIARQALGHEYEAKLITEIRQMGLDFIDEGQMRTLGYDKTPDVKLNVPISIDGTIINWIESKASFGDPVSHRRYLNSQLLSYLNRFGSGLVIYWFGFVEDLDIHEENGILIRTTLPKEVKILQIAQTVPSDSDLK